MLALRVVPLLSVIETVSVVLERFCEMALTAVVCTFGEAVPVPS